MIRRASLAALLAAAVATAGCVTERRPADQGPPNRWAPSLVSHVQVEVQPLTEAPNNGLLLPVVSGDGQWIAWMDLGREDPPELTSLFTGSGLESASIHVKSLSGDSEQRMLCVGGAAWPAWSSGGAKLAYIIHRGEGQCDACVYDAVTHKIVTLTLSVRAASMPALSPAGNRLAVVAIGKGSSAPRVHVIDLADGATIACDEPDAGAAHYWPLWADNSRLVFVRTGADGASAMHWSPRRHAPQRLCELAIGNSPLAVYQAMAGIAAPLSSDGRQLACYSTVKDRIVLWDLTGGQTVELAPATRAGCWLDSHRFAAADDQELRLYTQGRSSVRLMRGRWLPRHGANATNHLVLLTQAANPHAFGVVRMSVLSSEAKGRFEDPSGEAHTD